MCLVLLRKCLIYIRRSGSLFFFIGERLAYSVEVLYGRIEFKIKGWSDAELRQSMFNCSLHKCIYDLFIFKFYFLFGGMNIDVYLRRVEINE